MRQRSENLRLDLQQSMRVPAATSDGWRETTIDTYGSSNDAYVEGSGNVISPGLIWYKYADVLHRENADVLHTQLRACNCMGGKLRSRWPAEGQF